MTEEMDLPKGWAFTNLESIISISSGKGLPKTKMVDGDIPVYGGNGVTGMHNAPNVIEPTIVIGRVGFYCGSVHLTPQDAWVTDNAFITRFNSQCLDKMFLYRLLTATNLRGDDSSTAQPVISGRKVYPIEILLPPLAEQKVIADKLDSLLAQVETTKARLDRIPEILKRFRQSVLAAAVSGRLTEEWRVVHQQSEKATELKGRWLFEREEAFHAEQTTLVANGIIKRPRKYKLPSPPDLETMAVDSFPKEWCLVSVSEFAECLDSQRIPVKRDQRDSAVGLYPYFGANGEVDRVDNYLFDDELVLVTEDETFYGRVKPIAYRFSGKCWVNNHAHVLRAPTKEANDFLCYSLMYYKVIPWLSGSTGRAKLTQAALNSLPIGLPPTDEQVEIVRRVGELFAFADAVEQKSQAASERVNNLTQSILAKAFRGDLTKDWRAANPNLISGENSAEVLLEKIKVEREALKPKKKTRSKKVKG